MKGAMRADSKDALISCFSSIPNLQAKVSSEDIENWFDDNYWVKRFEIFDDALCDIMSSKKDTKIDS